MPDRPPCRCLLQQNHEDLARLVADYVESLPPESRACEETRRARLSVCLNCPHLADGTCALCGCYVEARAAKRGQTCPDVPPRWDNR